MEIFQNLTNDELIDWFKAPPPATPPPDEQGIAHCNSILCP